MSYNIAFKRDPEMEIVKCSFDSYTLTFFLFWVFFVFVSMHPIFRSDYPLPPDGLNTF